MAGTGWIWVTSCLVALVASQSCPDQDSSLKKWSEDATWNGEVYMYVYTGSVSFFSLSFRKKNNEFLSNIELICFVH